MAERHDSLNQSYNSFVQGDGCLFAFSFPETALIHFFVIAEEKLANPILPVMSLAPPHFFYPLCRKISGSSMNRCPFQ